MSAGPPTAPRTVAERRGGAFDPLAGLRRMPEVLECEQTVLGSLLVASADAGQWHAAMSRLGWLRPEHFHEPVHARLWQRFQELRAEGEVPHVQTLVNWARAQAELGELPAELRNGKYLAALARNAETVINVGDYARAIVDTAVARALIHLAEDLHAECYDPGRTRPALELASGFAERAQALLGEGDTRRGRTLREVAQLIARRLERGPAPRDRTGLAAVDAALGGGLFAGKLYGVAARMKQGKSCLLGTIALHLNRSAAPVLYIAGEMGDTEIVERMIAADAGFNAGRFLNEDAHRDERLVQAVIRAATAAPEHLVFENVPGLTFSQLQALFAHYAATRRVKGVIVDYWQLVGGKRPGQSMTDHLDEVAQWLADAARRFGVWVLAAAQINRQGETRGGDGLNNACDLYLHLRAVEGDPVNGAWLEMERSRYTAKGDIGSEAQPALRVDRAAGLRFVPCRPPARRGTGAARSRAVLSG